ncbi:hypothetical protein ZHAS_00017944 [Anopheles sinensis]|uniref:GCV_T domain-containing protein n=1 Tax=Anopheles sinensis TaxID=74873 RepID=A0A084WI69_ANOSI|nr:hypothetical protein ZHAS_00017944 [Anopheles sinensis]
MLLRRSIVAGTFIRRPVRPQCGLQLRHQSVSTQKPLTLQPLADRSFIRVHGTDSASFLQGLMTNDMRHFEHCGAIYSMFLKANGRVFCDALIYKRPKGEQHDYLLECDSSVAVRLEKHLRLYRLKKKVDVVADETFRLWVAFRDGVTHEETPSSEETSSDKNLPDATDQLHPFRDPRLTRLGYRVLSSNGTENEAMEQLHKMFPGASDSSNPLSYTAFRYALGVGEGGENLPDGKCFPLECNCDYLHGVSFHKGCYIGQELTARTYHTGVIRKRLMPLEFNEPLPPVSRDVPPEALRDAEIKNRDGAVVGKLRGLAGNLGLGLLRIEKVLPDGQLSLNVAGVSDPIACRTRKPFWWPKETNTRH